ncbi:hypothetical protein ISP15_01995 [Dyella jejuensis]|uniref:DUF2884 family protein n=1 Tax=Dyella jejuensis TaxID=1432009 RepID=A0ABW8JF34_9GAMM
MKHATVCSTLALCSLLAACGDHSADRSITFIHSGDHHLLSVTGSVNDMAHGSIRLGDGQVTIRAQDAPDAIITAEGDLRIREQAVAVDPAERALLKAYYTSAMMIRTDGIATGKAGAEVGEQAVKSVATRLANGDPDQIEHDIDAKTKLVKEAAMKICLDLGNTMSSQHQLAATLPAFKPYGNVISPSDVSDCSKDQND